MKQDKEIEGRVEPRDWSMPHLAPLGTGKQGTNAALGA